VPASSNTARREPLALRATAAGRWQIEIALLLQSAPAKLSPVMR